MAMGQIHNNQARKNKFTTYTFVPNIINKTKLKKEK